MSDTCPRCNRSFNDNPIGSLVTQAFIDGRYVTICPLCYDIDHLGRHGCLWNPKGEIASAMFQEAVNQHPEHNAWREEMSQ